GDMTGTSQGLARHRGALRAPGGLPDRIGRRGGCRRDRVPGDAVWRATLRALDPPPLRDRPGRFPDRTPMWGAELGRGHGYLPPRGKEGGCPRLTETSPSTHNSYSVCQGRNRERTRHGNRLRGGSQQTPGTEPADFPFFPVFPAAV